MGEELNLKNQAEIDAEIAANSRLAELRAELEDAKKVVAEAEQSFQNETDKLNYIKDNTANKIISTYNSHKEDYYDYIKDELIKLRTSI